MSPHSAHLALFRLFLLASLTNLFSTVSADVPSFQSNKAYDDANLGHYPVQLYASTSVVSPHVNFARKSKKCDDGLYVFIAPRGGAVHDAGPTILDNDGHLIWTKPVTGQPYNLMVQEFQGKKFLTYWLGDDTVQGHGAGTYYMLDETYKVVSRIKGAGGLAGDLHEFRITPNGTALITVYEIIRADLTAFKGHPYDGYIWDGIVQEVDLVTGTLLFQWRASDHYKVTDTYENILGHGKTSIDAFDWYHINSIEKDAKGNYLVSARYTHSITYIEGSTGKVLWILGGKLNMFQDLSDGAATSFAWQHDARWHDNGTILTIFDNGAESGHYTNKYSRGLKLALDFEKMTVKVVKEYIHPDKVITSSQGSLQILPSGNVLLGYGFTALYTEFSPEGEALCDVHLAPKSRFETGDVQSYRALKYAWTGRPSYPPDIGTQNGAFYASWNGATEVFTWVLQDSDRDTEDSNSFESIASAHKSGFETAIGTGSLMRPLKAYARVAALDKGGKVLGYSKLIETGAPKGFLDGHLNLDGYDTKPITLIIIAMMLISALMLLNWVAQFFKLGRLFNLGYQKVPWLQQPQFLKGRIPNMPRLPRMPSISRPSMPSMASMPRMDSFFRRKREQYDPV